MENLLSHKFENYMKPFAFNGNAKSLQQQSLRFAGICCEGRWRTRNYFNEGNSSHPMFPYVPVSFPNLFCEELYINNKYAVIKLLSRKLYFIHNVSLQLKNWFQSHISFSQAIKYPQISILNIITIKWIESW